MFVDIVFEEILTDRMQEKPEMYNHQMRVNNFLSLFPE